MHNKIEVREGFTFKKVERDGKVTTLHIPFTDHLLSDLLSDFEYFLRGCGYSFNGHVDIFDMGDGK